MNKCQFALVLFLGIQIGMRLPSAKVAAEQFKDSVGARVTDAAAKFLSDQIIEAAFNNRTIQVTKREEK